MDTVFLRGAAAASILVLTATAVQASEFPGLADSRHIVERMHSEVLRVSRRSIPACEKAACVKGDCAAMGEIVAPMHRAAAWLTAYQERLEAWKSFHTELAENQLSEAQFSQEKADQLRKIEDYVSFAQDISSMAAEVASWPDFVLEYAESAQSFVTNAAVDGNFPKAYFFVENNFKRLKAVVGALASFAEFITDSDFVPEVSPSTKAKAKILQLAHDSVVLVGKAAGYLEELRSLSSDSGLSAEDKAKKRKSLRVKSVRSVAKVAKLVGDILVEFGPNGRMERLDRIDQYVKQNFAEHLVAMNALGAAREFNAVIQKAELIKQDIDKALTGAEACARRLCETPLPDKPDVAVEPPQLDGIPEGIRHYNAKLRAIEVDLDASTLRYRIAADFQSRVNLRKEVIASSESLHGLYHVAKSCIPEDARFHVIRQKDGVRGKSILKLDSLDRPDGSLRFRVSEDLSGEWEDSRGRRYTITSNKNGFKSDITVTRPNVPRRGRNRSYSGSSNELPARPGDYELVLYSEEEDRFYLPTPFTIEATGGRPPTEIVLRSFPFSVEDLSPKLRPEIADAVLRKVLSDRLSYKLNLKPTYEDDGSVSLSGEFWSYRFKWNETEGRLVEGSFRENMSRQTVLRPVATD